MVKATSTASLALAFSLSAAPILAHSVARGPKPVELDQEPPRRIRVEAVYPDDLKKSEHEARVRVRTVVDRTGRVVQAEASSVRSRPPGREQVFAELARNAVVASRWEAVGSDGPAHRAFVVDVDFRLPGKRVHHLSAEELVNDLGSDDPGAIYEAQEELVERGAGLLPLLLPLLGDEDPRRAHAISVVGRLGPAARVASPALLAAVRDPDLRAEGFLGLAAWALASVDPEALAGPLADALRSGDDEGCVELLLTLPDAAAQEPTVRALLFELLALPSCSHAALGAIGGLRLPAEAAALTRLLDSAPVPARRRAVDLVVRLLRETKPAPEALAPIEDFVRRSLADAALEVRGTAARALSLLGASGLGLAVAQLGSPDAAVVIAAADALRALGRSARAAAGEPLRAARAAARDEGVQTALDRALGATGAALTDIQLAAQDALLRMVAADQCRRRTKGIVYLSIEGTDPPADLLESLRAAGAEVRSGSEAAVDREKGVRNGWVVNVGPSFWLGGDLVRVQFSMWCGSLCAEYGFYLLAFRHGRWTIVHHRVDMVS